MKISILQGGRRLSSVQHDGQTFVPVPSEGSYEIELVNDTFRRRLAVVTVDGTNVIDGSKGSYDGRGYVLSPGETLVIKGWLRGDREAAAFTFAPRSASYAALVGHGEQSVGVIGVAVLSVLMGVVFSRVALRPLREIGRTARRIGTDNLTERIPVPATRDEVADLALLLNRMFDRLDSAFARVLAGRARAAYSLGAAHPGVCQTAPARAPYFYEEDSWADDMELAAAQLYALTHEAPYLTAALEFAALEPVTQLWGTVVNGLRVAADSNRATAGQKEVFSFKAECLVAFFRAALELALRAPERARPRRRRGGAGGRRLSPAQAERTERPAGHRQGRPRRTWPHLHARSRHRAVRGGGRGAGAGGDRPQPLRHHGGYGQVLAQPYRVPAIALGRAGKRRAASGHRGNRQRGVGPMGQGGEEAGLAPGRRSFA